MGFLPEAICNALLRLGWSHGDDEIISREQAIEWFNTENLGKSASRLDFAKLNNLNGHYIREADNERLLSLLLEMIGEVSEEKKQRLRLGMNGMKQRSKTLLELKDISSIYTNDFTPTVFEKKGQLYTVNRTRPVLGRVEEWTEENLEKTLRSFAEEIGISFGKVAQLLRGILTERPVTPSLFEMLVAFGKEECLRRIDAVLEANRN